MSYLVLAVFVLLLALGIKGYMLFAKTPDKVRLILRSAADAVDPGAAPGDRRAQFLQRWETALTSKSCPEVILHCDSSGFFEDSFMVAYTDSIELPGLPAFRRSFRFATPVVLPEGAP